MDTNPFEALIKANARLRKVIALQRASQKSNSYYPMIKIMSKLKLIKDWDVFH